MKPVRQMALCLVLALICSNGHANAVTIDWMNQGDGLLLQDSRTGLDWLNLSQTQGLSYSQVLDQIEAGQPFDGFRVATIDEVSGLLLTYGIDVGDITPFDSYEVIGAERDSLAQLIEDTGFSIYAYVDSVWEHPTLGELVRSAYFVTDTNGSDIGNINFGNSWLLDTAAANNSTFLIRDATVIPLPAAIWMFLAGIGALGFAGRANRSR